MGEQTAAGGSTIPCSVALSLEKKQTAILFGLLLAVQFAAAALMPLGAPGLDSSWKPFWLMTFGAAFSQPALLAVWSVFGQQRGAVRLPMTFWLAGAGCLSITFAVNQNAGETDPGGLLMGAAWLAAFILFQPLLWPIRALRRWRLERPDVSAADASRTVEAVACPAPKSPSQFSVRALLGWILATALLLGGFRALAAGVAMDRSQMFATLLEGGIGSLILALGALLATLPVIALAWIVLADGRRLLRIALSLAAFLGLAAACTVLGPVIIDLLEVADLLQLEAGVLLNAVVSFGAFRACRYRLRRHLKRDAAGVEQIATAPVSRMRFAFGAAPLAVLAACLAAIVPDRLEQWRQAEVGVSWRRDNLETSFAADGTIDALKYCQPSPISDDQCRRIASVGTLRSLVLSDSALDDRQLALLAPLGRLERLDLTATAVTDAGLKHLARFSQLVALDLANTPISDAGLARLKALPRLRELTLSLTDASDDGLLALDALPAMESVDATFTAVTSAGAERFRQTHPRASVDFGASDSLLALCPKFHREYIIQRTVLGYGSCDQSTKLKRLHARGKTVTNGVAAGVTDAGLVTLAAHTELEELDLRDSEVTDKGILKLRPLANLKCLDLRGAPVTEQGVQRLARVLPDCEILR